MIASGRAEHHLSLIGPSLIGVCLGRCQSWRARCDRTKGRFRHCRAGAGSRAGGAGSFSKKILSEKNLANVRALNKVAQKRGQTLAQMAIAWVLRDARVTSALVGARTVEQLDNSLDALKNLEFSEAELKAIDKHALEGGLDLWKGAREGTA